MICGACTFFVQLSCMVVFQYFWIICNFFWYSNGLKENPRTFFSFNIRSSEKQKCIHSDFLGSLKYQKNKKFSKIIDKTPYRRVAQKRDNFATGAANHTFFDSHCIYFHLCSREDEGFIKDEEKPLPTNDLQRKVSIFH